MKFIPMQSLINYYYHFSVLSIVLCFVVVGFGRHTRFINLMNAGNVMLLMGLCFLPILNVGALLFLLIEIFCKMVSFVGKSKSLESKRRFNETFISNKNRWQGGD